MTTQTDKKPTITALNNTTVIQPQLPVPYNPTDQYLAAILDELRKLNNAIEALKHK